MTKTVLKEKFVQLTDEQMKQLLQCRDQDALYSKFKEFIGEDFAMSDLKAVLSDFSALAENNEAAITMMQTIHNVIETVPGMQEKLAAAHDNAAAYALLKQYLGDVTLANFEKACQSVDSLMNDVAPISALTDIDLEAVTGGSWKSFWSGFKTGFVDTFKIIGSAVMIGVNVVGHNPSMAEKWGEPLEKSVKHLSDALHNK